MEHTVTHQASALNFMDKPLQMEKMGQMKKQITNVSFSFAVYKQLIMIQSNLLNIDDQFVLSFLVCFFLEIDYFSFLIIYLP